jgi:hypothetical protein
MSAIYWPPPSRPDLRKLVVTVWDELLVLGKGRDDVTQRRK